MTEPPLLELRGITKRFPGIVANDHVDFELAKGEVHALLGENGAGKSTLMNILYGLYHPDEGEVRLRGEPVRIDSPNAAIEHGIGMVHQHFMLIPVMTVAENIVLAVEPRKGPFLDLDAAEKRVRELSERFGLAVRPDARIESISVGMQQRVEILKALYRGAEILILDEPRPSSRRRRRRSCSRSFARSRPRGSRSSSSPTSSARCSRSPTGSPSSGAARRSRPCRARARPRRASRA